MNSLNTISVLHINEAVTPGGSLVVMDSLIKATTKEKIINNVVIAATPEKLDITLDGIKFNVLRPKYSYLESSQLISLLAGKNKYYRMLHLILFELKKAYYNCIYLFYLISIIRHNAIDVAHIHSAILPCIACIITRTPYLYHLHGLNSKYSKFSIFLINSAQVIVAISKYIGQTANELGFNEKKIKVIANPLRPFPEPKPMVTKFKHNPNDILIGHFGRIVPWKGQLEFIKSFALAKQKITRLSALIIGEVTDGNDAYLQLLIDKLKELEISDSVMFLGYKKNTEDYYNICDIIVHSSIEPEPFGLVIIEAMAAGKPVIASSLGAAPEIIDNGNTGLIANPADKTELSAQIIKLAESEQLRKRLGKNAKIAANQNYNLEFIANKFSMVYRNICNQ